MANTVAYMLRQDGQAFTVPVHPYASGDPDLASEAECAAFIINTGSKGQTIAYEVLDAFMALQIENRISYNADSDEICKCIDNALSSLPYTFMYPITNSDMVSIHESLNNYTDVDSLYDYIDSLNIAQLQKSIRDLINQQFCRVRYGGKYDYESDGANTIWFRVSSVGYNWANTIYLFVAQKKTALKLQYVSICRDYESDYGDSTKGAEYFYKAKDGAPYFNMPIAEYLAEEHEHSPVFSTVLSAVSGVFASIRSRLANGHTLNQIEEWCTKEGIKMPINCVSKIHNDELKSQCIEASEFWDLAHTRTKTKLAQARSAILKRFPELDFNLDEIEVTDHANTQGTMVGIEITYTLYSEELPALNGVKINTVFNKGIGEQSVRTLLAQFSKEYLDYCKFKRIER